MILVKRGNPLTGVLLPYGKKEIIAFFKRKRRYLPFSYSTVFVSLLLYGLHFLSIFNILCFFHPARVGYSLGLIMLIGVSPFSLCLFVYRIYLLFIYLCFG